MAADMEKYLASGSTQIELRFSYGSRDTRGEVNGE